MMTNQSLPKESGYFKEFMFSLIEGEKVKKDQLVGDCEEFVCKICCEHVIGASPVLTRCSHLFCGDCFSRWAENCPVQQSWAQKVRKANRGAHAVPCPVCDEMLDVHSDVDDICKDPSSGANVVHRRMLWRLLHSLKLCCKNNPERKGGSCQWVGMYGEYHEHIGQCENGNAANAEEEECAYSDKTVRSRSPGSTDADSRNESESFPDSQDFSDLQDFSDSQELHTSLPDVATPQTFEQEVEEELPEGADTNVAGVFQYCTEPNVVPFWSDAQKNSFPFLLDLQWRDQRAAEEKSYYEEKHTSLEDCSVEVSELPHLISLLSQIDKDDEEVNVSEDAPDGLSSSTTPPLIGVASTKKSAMPPLSPASANGINALLVQLRAGIDRRVKEATPPLLPPKVGAPIVQQQAPPPPPTMAPAEVVPASAPLNQLIPPPPPLEQATTTCKPQTNRPRADPHRYVAVGTKLPFRSHARFDFNPTQADQIPLQAGESIDIYNLTPGWCHCRSHARPNEGCGWVPSWVLAPASIDGPHQVAMPGFSARPVSETPSLPFPKTMKAAGPVMQPLSMSAEAIPASAASMSAPMHANVFPGPAPGVPPAPATTPRLPPPPPGICAPPSEPPSTKMPHVPAPLQQVLEVRRPCMSMGPSLISLAPGDLVEIFRQGTSGWAYGCKINSADKVHVQGWFPTWVFQ